MFTHKACSRLYHFNVWALKYEFRLFKKRNSLTFRGENTPEHFNSPSCIHSEYIRHIV